MTRFGAVVRADSVRQLTPAGWQALLDYGVRTIVDLRLASERDGDPPHPETVDIVHVPLGDEPGSLEREELDRRFRSRDDVPALFAELYEGLVERFAEGIARAAAAVGSAPPGGVLVHCYAGKDRTGLVCALLLRLACVAPADVAADYALSAAYLEPTFAAWLAEASDEAERAFRRRIAASPAEAMLDVLRGIERRHGSVRGYLLGAGAGERELERARARLVASPSAPPL